MNKNKIIFLILWIVFIIIFVSIFLLLSKTGETKRSSSSSWDFKIWVLHDDKNKFWTFLNDFKEKYSAYKNTSFQVVSFQNYEEYYHSLVWSFLRWEAPDMFVVNNNDAPFFEKQISGIDPSVISPDDFRKKYEIVFSNDLIKKTNIDNKEVEFLIGIPLGYENLWIFYNFREIRNKNLSTWSYINEVVREIRENTGKTAIGIGNGSTVQTVPDIITQFFLLDNMKNISQVSGNSMKSALGNYIRFWDINQDNKYDELFDSLLSNNKNNIDAFSRWDVQIVLGYPRLLEEIDKKWFNKWFLRAEPFPTYQENNGNIFIDYNYFVINKNTPNYTLAQDLMVYFDTSEGQKKYLEIFNYYMPSQMSLVANRLEENIKSGYNIKYKDFYNQNFELTTFQKGVKTIYDSDIIKILDSKTNSIELFENFRKKVLCISEKTLSSENLERSCN